MSTTSLKLPDDIRQLVAQAATSEGISAHAFMIRAVSEAAVNADKRAQFVDSAVASRQQALQTGRGYAADDVHAWLQAKAAGKTVRRPKAHDWRE